MKFNVKYEGNRGVLVAACVAFNGVIPELFKELEKKMDFDMSNCRGRFIAQIIRDYRSTTQIKTYRPWNPWSKALAYVSPKEPNVIYINSRRLNRSIASIAGSIAHETIHVLDNKYTDANFGHGNNSPKGKENTVPYWIGRRVKELILKDV